ASPADCEEVDVRDAPWQTWSPCRNPTARGPDGGRESDVGLHADPRRAQERWPPRGPLDHSADPESGGPAAGPAAADLVADVLEGSLGCDRRGGLLYDGSVDLARVGDVLRGVRHRSRLAPCRDRGLHATPDRAVHAAGHAPTDGSGCWPL